MDIASVILVVIAVILWLAIFLEKFVHPYYKNKFRGSRLWPDDEVEKNRLKKCIQGVGLYYLAASLLLLLFSPALALLMLFGGIFYTLIIYYWLVVSKRG